MMKEIRIIMAAISDPSGESIAITGYIYDNKEKKCVRNIIAETISLEDTMTKDEIKKIDKLEILAWTEKMNAKKKKRNNKSNKKTK